MDLDEQNVGGGSGGGGDDDGRNILKSADGGYEIAGSQVVLFSRPPIPPPTDTDPDGPYAITLLAAGNVLTGKKGFVDIRGNQHVRITSGGPPLPNMAPPVTLASGALDGIQLHAATDQTISLQRGVDYAPMQQILMTSGGINIDAADGSIMITCLKKITLSVASGASSIELTPEGITISGLIVRIN